MVNKSGEVRPWVSESETDHHTLDLVAFGLVVDRGSITVAARELGETKGSVSRRVARLERQVGVPLLTRTGRTVEPTDAGRVYRAGVARALEALEDARAVVRGLDAEPRGTLRITAPPGVGTPLLAPVVAALVERWPHLVVDVRLTDAVLSFAEHGVDVALRIAPSLPDSSLVARRLFDLDGCLVASPAYLARHGVPVRPEDLDAHRLVIPPVTGATLRLRLAPAATPTAWREVRLRGTVLCHDVLFGLQSAVAGGGIAVAPRHAATPEIEAGRLVPVLADHVLEPSVSLWLVHLPGPMSPKVRAFRELLEERVAGGCGGRDTG